MDEIIYAVIVLMWILGAIAESRAKKKKQQEAAEAAGDEWRDREESVSSWEPPVADDPDGDGIPGQPRPEYTRSYGDRGTASPDSSEGLVPPDLWEEIGALARGDRLPAPEPEPSEARPWEEASREVEERQLPSRIPAGSPIRRGQVGAREVGSHPVHESHAEYGTDPSERTPVPTARSGGPGREVRAVRRMLVEGGPAAARRAVILHEVLDKPLAYRDDGPGGAGS